ncbi:MAG: hypothetical protein JWL70_1248 [Acidimicrobiia bacterium]|nr:hypothetical protein [Acidimicrobiia bacterium]
MRCTKHPFDRGQDICSHCGLIFCGQCLVYPGGAGKDPFCIQCTVARAVRGGSSVKAVKRRELKQRRQQLADYLETCPPTFEGFVDLAPIVDPLPSAQDDRGERTDRPVDWCA